MKKRERRKTGKISYLNRPSNEQTKTMSVVRRKKENDKQTS